VCVCHSLDQPHAWLFSQCDGRWTPFLVFYTRVQVRDMSDSYWITLNGDNTLVIGYDNQACSVFSTKKEEITFDMDNSHLRIRNG
jgi:hypothetical protein